MSKVRIYNDGYFEDIANIFKQHKKIARTPVNSNYDLVFIRDKLNDPSTITFCYFDNNDVLTSFMITKQIKSLHTWAVVLVSSRKTSFFNPIKNGISSLYDSSIEYWEQQNIFNFIYVQPRIFLSSGNKLTRQGSKKLQTYTPHHYLTVPAGQSSEYLLIKVLMNDRTFDEDMIVKWCFKNEE